MSPQDEEAVQRTTQEIVAALPPQWVQFERCANVGLGAWRDDADAALAVLRRFIITA